MSSYRSASLVAFLGAAGTLEVVLLAWLISLVNQSLVGVGTPRRRVLTVEATVEYDVDKFTARVRHDTARGPRCFALTGVELDA